VFDSNSFLYRIILKPQRLNAIDDIFDATRGSLLGDTNRAPRKTKRRSDSVEEQSNMQQISRASGSNIQRLDDLQGFGAGEHQIAALAMN
jgi:hypothetical protein